MVVFGSCSTKKNGSVETALPLHDIGSPTGFGSAGGGAPPLARPLAQLVGAGAWTGVPAAVLLVVARRPLHLARAVGAESRARARGGLGLRPEAWVRLDGDAGHCVCVRCSLFMYCLSYVYHVTSNFHSIPNAPFKRLKDNRSCIEKKHTITRRE